MTGWFCLSRLLRTSVLPVVVLDYLEAGGNPTSSLCLSVYLSEEGSENENRSFQIAQVY